MITRREFAKLTALSPATLVTTAPKQAAAESLPPSIFQLKSRRDEARPITTQERDLRCERARQLMNDNKVDAIIMTGGTSLNYFTGVRWWNSERLFAAVMPAKGELFYV